MHAELLGRAPDAADRAVVLRVERVEAQRCQELHRGARGHPGHGAAQLGVAEGLHHEPHLRPRLNHPEPCRARVGRQHDVGTFGSCAIERIRCCTGGCLSFGWAQCLRPIGLGVVKLARRFHLTDKHARMLDEQLKRRKGTYEEDLAAMYEILKGE